MIRESTIKLQSAANPKWLDNFVKTLHEIVKKLWDSGGKFDI